MSSLNSYKLSEGLSSASVSVSLSQEDQISVTAGSNADKSLSEANAVQAVQPKPAPKAPKAEVSA